MRAGAASGRGCRRAEALNALLPAESAVLDCAAGTGIYALHLARGGHRVTATDFAPRHVAMLASAAAANPDLQLETGWMDARDMSRMPDDAFDVVLNMGPFYHLPDEADRRKCLSESLRLLRPGGLLAVSYISRFSVFPYVGLTDRRFLTEPLFRRLLDSGEIRSDDPDCFWTDTWYADPMEMETLMTGSGCAVVDHFMQDGLSPLLKDRVDNLSEAEFEVWRRYHRAICRERSILGTSGHLVIVGKKGCT